MTCLILTLINSVPTLWHAWKCSPHGALQQTGCFLCLGPPHVFIEYLLAWVDTHCYKYHLLDHTVPQWMAKLWTFSISNTNLPGLLQAIEADDQMGWLAFLKVTLPLNGGYGGIQEAHFLWLRCRNTGKHCATSPIVKHCEISWDIKDHWNQIKFNLETTQDLAQHNYILLAVYSEYSFGRSGLPHWDWHLFKAPLMSILVRSSLHYLDAWLLHFKTAHGQQCRHQTDMTNLTVTNADEHLPSTHGSCQTLQHFLASTPLLVLLLLLPPSPHSHLNTSL